MKGMQVREELQGENKDLNFIQEFLQKKEWLFLITITSVSAIIQIYFAMSTWGMITTDEVNQGLEIAHNIVFGYGTICPEFQISYPIVPHLAKCRSIIYPLLYVIPLYIGKILGLNYWGFTIPLIRFFLGVNGALLVPSTYFFIKNYTKGRRDYACFAAIIITFSPFIIFMAFRSIPNIAFIPWMLFILASYFKTLEGISNKQVERESEQKLQPYQRDTRREHLKKHLKIFLLTIAMGLIIYVRVDILVPLGVILVFKFPYKKLKVILSHLSGVVVAIFIGVVCDSIYYGQITASPLNWFIFNIVEGGSAMFGSQPFFFYFNLLFELKPIMVIVIMTLVFFVFMFIKDILEYKRTKKPSFSKTKILAGLLFASFAVILAFSFAEHKEFRFVYSGYVFFHLSIAVALAILIEDYIPKTSAFLIKIFNKLRRKKPKILSAKRFTLSIISVLFLLIVAGGVFATIKSTEIVDWRETDEISRGLAYVGQQSDSVGVVVVLRYMQGSFYSYLHKNISIIYFKDIVEYDRVDDLISCIQNEQDTYNYVILPQYQIEETPQLLEVLDYSHYSLVYNIDTRASIFSYDY